MRCAAAGLALTLAFAACGGGEPPGVEEQIQQRLEENRRSLPNDVASDAPVPHRSVGRFVRDYQKLGFFAGEDADRVARAITRDYTREWEEEPRIATRLDELFLLAYDKDRVWLSDIERDVLDGNEAYVEAFREWSRISAGDFEPRAVSERWQSEEGPVTIWFTLDGRQHEVEAAGQGDFLDLCVLTAGVNPIIAATGRQFAIYRPDAGLGQEAFIVALTAAERRALERHGWVFAAPHEVRLAFGYGQLYEDAEPSPCG